VRIGGRVRPHISSSSAKRRGGGRSWGDGGLSQELDAQIDTTFWIVELTLPVDGSVATDCVASDTAAASSAALKTRLIHPGLTFADIGKYDCAMARAATTSDVFNAIAERQRREILVLLRAGEGPVTELAQEMLEQPVAQLLQHPVADHPSPTAPALLVPSRSSATAPALPA
jgi:hypothetical protein